MGVLAEQMNGQTDRLMDGLADKQMYGQTHEWTDWQANKQTDRWMEILPDKQTVGRTVG